MRTSVVKSSGVDARQRSAAAPEGKRPPVLGIPEAALPQAVPPAELVALQRMIANRPDQRPAGAPAPAPAVSVQRDAGTGAADSGRGRGDAARGGGVGGGRELTQLASETRDQALMLAQSWIKRAFAAYIPADPTRSPSLAADEGNNIEYQSDRDFESGLARISQNQTPGGRPQSARGTYAYALGRTPAIRVRESIAEDPHLALLLTHELLHTLAKWPDLPDDLEESATQLLTLYAQEPSQPLTEARIEAGFVYTSQTNNLNELLSELAGEQRIPVLAEAYLQNSSARLDAKINARLSPGTDVGRSIFLAAFNRTWPGSIGGKSLPRREAALAKEDPIATVFGLLEGSRRLVNPASARGGRIVRSANKGGGG